jgi:uncharacterized repeat protein (TIGR01451 family)
VYQIVFTIQVSPTATGGSKTPILTASALNVCFADLGSGDHPLGAGTVVVRAVGDVVRLAKEAITDPVAPLSLAEYKITIANEDAYDFVFSALTDTLPTGFNFYSMTSGPAPAVEGNKLVWRNLTLPAAGMTLKFKVQVGPLYGTYENWVSAYIPDTTVNPKKGSPDIRVLPVFDLKKDVGVPVASQGAVVPYTITLVNTSDVVYTSLRITDTLPPGFQYHHSRPGYPIPIMLGPRKSQPVWLIASLGSGGKVQKLVFYALVTFLAEPGVLHYNTVIGSSPSGSIPGPISTAPLLVEQSGDIWTFLPLLMR